MEAKAREMEIYDLQPFLDSDIFSDHGFVLDRTRNAIIKSFQL